MMADGGVRASLEAIAASIADDPRFADIEVLRSLVRREHGAHVVVVVVDRAGGVDTDLCEAISRSIMRRVDALGPSVGDYRVEVSSAGLERPLIAPEHYRRFAGRDAKVITTLRIANRTEFTGAIGEVSAEAVTILDRYAGPTPIPFAAIKRANLAYDPAADLKRRT